MIEKKIINEYLRNKKNLTFLNKKIPLIRNWTEKKISVDQIYNYKNNLGWVLDKNDLVIDIDPRNGGNKSLKNLLKNLNISIDEINPSIKTPSGGIHCYLKIPETYQNASFRKTLPLQYPGIDFLTKGSMCVILGSSIDSIFYKKYKNNTKNFIFKQIVCNEKILNIIAEKKSNIFSYKKLKTDNFNIDDIEKIKNLLRNLDPSMNYNDWIKVGMALHSWNNKKGLELWDFWSKKGINYKEGEVHKKWKTFNNQKAITLGTIYHMNKKFTNQNKKNTKENTPEWCNAWVFVIDNSNFLNLKNLQFHNQISFNKINGEFIPQSTKKLKPSAIKYVCDNGFIENVNSSEYLPIYKKKIVNINNKKIVNTFNHDNVPKHALKYSKEGQIFINKIQKHIKFLFENNKDQEIFTYWLAHQIQFPGKKILWAPIICSIQGTGKSFLGEILKQCLGNENIGVVAPHQVTSEFNGWAKNVVVNILEELRIKGHNKFEIINSLKPLITDKHIQINEKCIKQYVATNVTNYICFTNEKDSIVLDKNDRRWWVIFSPIDDLNNLYDYVQEEKEDYFSSLFEGIYKYYPEVKKWLVELKIPKWFFDLKQAPMNDYKKSMILSENLNISGFFEVKELIEKGSKFFNKNVICCNDLFKEFSEKYPEILFKTTQKNNLLKKLGYIALPQNIKLDGKTRRVWAKKIISNEKIKQFLNQN